MANRRTMQVGGVTFTIHGEMTSTIDTTPEVHYAKKETCQVWPDGWAAGDSESLDVSCGNFTTTAKASADAADPAELRRWSAGFLQNINSMNRSATYTPGNIVINELLQSAQAFPIRDGESSEFPFFSDDEGRFTNNDVVVNVEASDQPHQKFPTELGSQSQYKVDGQLLDGVLNSTAGSIDFTIWFAFARQRADNPNPPDQNYNRSCLVLVNSQTWRQDFATTKNQDGSFSLPPALSTTSPVHNLHNQVFYQFQQPSTTFPDVREEATGNEQIYFQLNYPGLNGPIKWSTDDDGDADVFEQKVPIPNVPNFFQDE